MQDTLSGAGGEAVGDEKDRGGSGEGRVPRPMSPFGATAATTPARASVERIILPPRAAGCDHRQAEI